MAGTIVFDKRNGDPTETLLTGEVSLPRPQNISIKSNTQTYKSVSQNLSVETRSRGIQRWELSLDFPPLNREDAMRVYSFFINQQGSFDTFKVRLPAPLNRHAGIEDGTGDGVPRVDDSRANIARSINVTGFRQAPDTTDDDTCLVMGGFVIGDTNPITCMRASILKAGDLFTFSTHDKVYMVTSDLATNLSGEGTLNFTPPLLQDSSINGATININNVEMTTSILNDEFEFPIDENVFYKMSISLGERVNITITT